MQQQQKRPKFLNLFQIHLPVTGVVSILHRVSGALLFLAIPILIYVFDRSLDGESGFQSVMAVIAQPLIKFFLILLGWAMLHHLLAGIRYLLMDVALGTKLNSARATAWVINLISLFAFVSLFLGMWL